MGDVTDVETEESRAEFQNGSSEFREYLTDLSLISDR